MIIISKCFPAQARASRLDRADRRNQGSVMEPDEGHPRTRPRQRGARLPHEGVNVETTSGQAARRGPRKTSERIAVDIVHDIVSDGLRSGDHLPLEAAMGEQYQASRGSVREALRLLEVQGLVHLKPGPGGGPVVGTVDPANLARMVTLYFHLNASTYGELLDAQALLESLCAQRAACHPDRRDALRPFLDPEPPDSEVAYRVVTIAFHQAVYELADNNVLTLLTRSVTHIVTEHVVATMDPVELRPAILHEHAELATAIVAGRAPKAARLMATHFDSQHDFYRERWPARLDELIEWR
jgi:DNA-binding FadR family transcriptional regulator